MSQLDTIPDNPAAASRCWSTSEPTTSLQEPHLGADAGSRCFPILGEGEFPAWAQTLSLSILHCSACGSQVNIAFWACRLPAHVSCRWVWGMWLYCAQEQACDYHRGRTSWILHIVPYFVAGHIFGKEQGILAVKQGKYWRGGSLLEIVICANACWGWSRLLTMTICADASWCKWILVLMQCLPHRTAARQQWCQNFNLHYSFLL